MLKDLMKSDMGCVLVSVLLGLGLATMFHKVCAGRDCVIVKGPNVEYVTKHMWRNGEECFHYRARGVDCPDAGSAAEQAADGAEDDVL